MTTADLDWRDMMARWANESPKPLRSRQLALMYAATGPHPPMLEDKDEEFADWFVGHHVRQERRLGRPISLEAAPDEFWKGVYDLWYSMDMKIEALLASLPKGT